jgi:anaerobic nitric oxide reductase transcription regulator
MAKRIKNPALEFDMAALEVARDLTRALSQPERLARLLEQLKRSVPFDAAAILLCHGKELAPAAALGLPREIMGRRFLPEEHPRLAAILDTKTGVVFASDDPRPDPYDGMLTDGDFDETTSVHSCMGARLTMGDEIFGVLTVDAAGTDRFTPEIVEHFWVFAALAAAALQVGTQIESLQDRVHRGEEIVSLLSRSGSVELIGESRLMKRLDDEMQIVAKSDLSVLITGETGTGKELVAHRLHDHSLRRGKPMVHVNCAALPESIAESELFGHVKGAFTGAIQDRMGKFELAEGGTLFLDEIGELPLVIQAKLLRAIQFGEIQRVGSDRSERVDVRLIAATNRDLEVEVSEGRFREDLFHRISVYPIQVPALRDRLDDIDLLSGFFLERHRGKLGTKPLRLSPHALEDLRSYTWPGNVRELEHVLMRAALRAQKRGDGSSKWVTLESTDLSLPTEMGSSFGTDLTLATREFQANLISRALAACGQNYAEAARALGVDRSNLHRLAKRLELS